MLSSSDWGLGKVGQALMIGSCLVALRSDRHGLGVASVGRRVARAVFMLGSGDRICSREIIEARHLFHRCHRMAYVLLR